MSAVRTVALFYREGSSDKEYRVQLDEVAGGFTVTGYNGRRGAALTAQPKTKGPVTRNEADVIFDRLVAQKKTKGYTGEQGGTPYAGGDLAGRKTDLLPQLLNAVSCAVAESLLDDHRYGLMFKADGERVMARKVDSAVTGVNRKGLERPLPVGLVDALASAPCDFILDGELVGERYFVFDAIEAFGRDLRADAFAERYAAAVKIAHVVLGQAVEVIPLHSDGKAEAFRRYQRENREGVVFKMFAAPYNVGRPECGGPALKHKFVETASAIVSGHNEKRSVSLVLLDDEGVERSVGNVTVKANQEVPSVRSIVEIRYLYAYEGGSLCQPELIAVRGDISADECTLSQLKYKVVS
jgi:bifunctional non-homologous end joining protein LigD